MDIDCSKNAFCASLTDELRKEFCAQCNRRLIRAGSMQLYRDFERNATLILDGAIMSSIHVGEDVLDYSEDVPTFYLGVPGRILATNVTFKRESKMHYGDNGMEYLTDCCIATFEHDVLRELFYTNNDFAQSMALSMLRVMEDTCEMTAILRAQSVYLSVHHMVRYLSGFNIYLTQQQIAEITNHDRASISKAISKIKENHPQLSERYMHNKKRPVEMCNPREW